MKSDSPQSSRLFDGPPKPSKLLAINVPMSSSSLSLKEALEGYVPNATKPGLRIFGPSSSDAGEDVCIDTLGLGPKLACVYEELVTPKRSAGDGSNRI